MFPPLRLPSPQLPPSGWWLTGLLAFYVLAGLFFHDPWKTDDAVNIGVTLDLLTDGHWLAPELAGRPWREPPLYHWLAALSARLFEPLLPLHAGMRASNILWLSITLVCLYYASRERYGKHYAAAAPLLLIGSVGLIVDAHLAQPTLAALAAVALALTAAAIMPRRLGFAAWLWGLSGVIAALAGGFGVCLPMAAYALCLGVYACLARPTAPPPLVSAGALAPDPTKRTPLPTNLDDPRFAEGRLGRWLWALPCLAVGFALAFALIAWARAVDPSAFAAWIEQEHKDWQRLAWYGWTDHWVRLPWFAWPSLPLAAWTLWRYRREWSNPSLISPTAMFAVWLFYLVGIAPSNERDLAMLLLPPLTLLATPAVLTMPRGAANAFDSFSKLLFSLVLLLIWLVWAAINWYTPAPLAPFFRQFVTGFTASMQGVDGFSAIALTVFWLWLAITLKRSPYRGITLWCGGFTTMWLLIVTLWLPWIDHGKSYRSVSQAMAVQLGKAASRKSAAASTSPVASNGQLANECVAERGVGDAQRASFAYFAGLRLEPWVNDASASCKWLLVQGKTASELAPPSPRFRKIWEGGRQNDRSERFRLYLMSPAKER